MQTLRRGFMAAVLVLLLATTARGDEKSLAGMYPTEVLKHWRPIFETHVVATENLNIARHLSIAGKEKLATIQMSLPVDPAAERLFDFGYDANRRTVVLPVFSIKFIYDMLATVTWFQNAGYDDQSFLYMLALKYKDAGSFPGGRYLSPLDAFGIPHSDFMEVKWESLRAQIVFEEYFNSAMLFIVAHEIGHGFDEEFVQRSPKDREGFADVFAAEMLGRSQFTYVGIVAMLADWVLWEKRASDFDSVQAYKKWLAGREEYPLASERVRAFGLHLTYFADQLFPPSQDREAQVARARTLGNDLIAAAASMQDLEKREGLRKLGERVDVASLNIANRKKPAPKSNTKDSMPPEPTDVRKRPPRKLSDVADKADLVKLSGTWWGLTLQEFPAASGLKAGQYQVGEDPVDKSRKLIVPVAAVSRTLWGPAEVVPFVFRFDDKLGLVEISGFLGGKKQDEFLQILTKQYGEPTRVMKALDFVTYVWEYDQSALELNFMSFTIIPNLQTRLHPD